MSTAGFKIIQYVSRVGEQGFEEGEEETKLARCDVLFSSQMSNQRSHRGQTYSDTDM